MSKQFTPPVGSDWIIHSRTIPDIIWRTLFIHVLAGYIHVQLNFFVFQIEDYMKLALQMLSFVFMPEFLVVQVCGLFIKWLAHWRKYAGISISKAWTSRLDLDTQNHANLVERLSKLHIVLLGLSCLPLLLVCSAYQERLAMGYHVATNVATLKFDHRNGWCAFAGVAAAILILVVCFWKYFFESRDERDESGDLNRSNRDLLTNIVNDTYFQIFVTTLIHQILLLVTNHWVPITHLLHFPGVFIIVAFGSMLVYFRQNRGLVLKCCVIFGFLITVFVQLADDACELQEVSKGVLKAYNYRWQVRDWASWHGYSDE